MLRSTGYYSRESVFRPREMILNQYRAEQGQYMPPQTHAVLE